MIVQIKIPDSVYEKYSQHRPSDPELAISQQLTRFAEVNPTDRVLLVPNKERQELEALMDTTFTSAKELVSRTKQLAELKVEGMAVPLSPDVLQRLAEQAEFEGMTQREFLELKVAEGVSYVTMGGL